MENNKVTIKQVLEELKDRADHDEYVFRKDIDREKAISFLEENNKYIEIIEKNLEDYEKYKEILGIFKENCFIECLEDEEDSERAFLDISCSKFVSKRIFEVIKEWLER